MFLISIIHDAMPCVTVTTHRHKLKMLDQLYHEVPLCWAILALHWLIHITNSDLLNQVHPTDRLMRLISLGQIQPVLEAGAFP